VGGMKAKMSTVHEQFNLIHFAGHVRRVYAETAARLGIQSTGWLAWPQEAQALYDCALAAPGPVLEVGCFMGTSACYEAAPGKQHVYTVDPHSPDYRSPTQAAILGDIDTAEVALATWEELGISDRITMVRASSVSASQLTELPTEFGMVFIDGDHNVAPCALDLEIWGPRVMPGGFLCVHDYNVRGDEAEAWDVAGCAARYIASTGLEWMGPVVCGNLAYYRREA